MISFLIDEYYIIIGEEVFPHYKVAGTDSEEGFQLFPQSFQRFNKITYTQNYFTNP